jgi:hypothetical protein
MRTVRESAGDGGDANEQLARAIVAARGNLRLVNLPPHVLMNVTELVYPKIDDPSFPETPNYELFRKLPVLKRIVIPPGAPVFPEQYLVHARAEQVVIAESSIRQKLFLSATGIKNVVVTASEEGASSGYSSYAFARSSIEKIVFEDGVKSIPGGACYQCPNLKSVVMPRSVRRINMYAFAGCTELSYVKMPDSEFEAGDSAFADCVSLGQADLRKCKCEEKSFAGTGLVSVRLECPVVEEEAFLGCGDLREVEFGPDVQEIKQNAFKGCRSLQAVDLPFGLSTVGQTAFRNCISLETICVNNVQSNYMTQTGVYPFRGCSGVETVYFNFVATPRERRTALARLGLSEKQIGSDAANGTTSAFAVEGGGGLNGKIATIGVALGKIGVKTRYKNGQLCAVFENGIRVDLAEQVMEAVGLAGPDAEVVFADKNMARLKSVSDLSQIKAIVFLFGKERAA